MIVVQLLFAGSLAAGAGVDGQHQDLEVRFLHALKADDSEKADHSDKNPEEVDDSPNESVEDEDKHDKDKHDKKEKKDKHDEDKNDKDDNEADKRLRMVA